MGIIGQDYRKRKRPRSWICKRIAMQTAYPTRGCANQGIGPSRAVSNSPSGVGGLFAPSHDCATCHPNRIRMGATWRTPPTPEEPVGCVDSAFGEPAIGTLPREEKKAKGTREPEALVTLLFPQRYGKMENGTTTR